MAKLCKDCRYFRPAGYAPLLFGAGFSYGESCSVPVPDDVPRNVVDGRPLVGVDAHDPWFLRSEQGWCTPAGLMWEEAPPVAEQPPEPVPVLDASITEEPQQPTFWTRIFQCFK